MKARIFFFNDNEYKYQKTEFVIDTENGLK